MPEKLKKGWTRVSFGDVVRLCRERSADPAEDGFDRYVGLEHLDPGDLSVRRWGNTADGTTFTNLFRAGQVLFGKRRAYQRKVAVADFDGVCSGDIYVLESSDPKHLLPDLLPFICQTDSFFEHAVGTSAGSLSPRTNWESLASFEFNLPPLDEQRRIAEMLEATQECKEAHLALGKMCSAVRGAFVAGTILGVQRGPCEGALDSHVLRPGWRVVAARDLATEPITKGATPSANLTATDTGIPFLKVYNLCFDGTLDFSIDPTFITEAGHEELRRSVVRPGDVLMNIVGPPLGKVSRVPPDFPVCNINQAIARFRVGSDALAEWLTLFLLSPVAQGWFFARSKKTSGQRNITLEMCQDLPVPLPPDSAMRGLLTQIKSFGGCLEAAEHRVEESATLGRLLIKDCLEE